MKNSHRGDLHTALTVGEVATRSGVAVSTLHFYESAGLIRSWRNQGNQRRYAREVLRSAPGSLLHVSVTLSAEDWKRLSARWRADLTCRIDRLTRLRDQLDGCIGCGCLSLGVCPLRNPADKCAMLGPGPRFLDPAPE